MSTVQALIVGAFVVVISLMLFLIGAVMVIRGGSSARNTYIALLGDETVPGDIDTNADTTTVKLSGTVGSVTDPIETARGEEVAVYHLKAVVRNLRNMASKRKDKKWLLAEGVQLDRVVVDGSDGQFELTAEPVDENREWGGIQKDTERGYGTALSRTDFATDEWVREEKYADDDGVPDHVVDYLEGEFDADVDIDVSKRGVSLTVSEDVVTAGDTVRVVGKVQPSAGATAARERVAVADGGDTPVFLNLTPGATVTRGSWWALAESEMTSAGLLPAGLAFIAMGIAAPLLVLAQAGVVSLGLGL